MILLTLHMKFGFDWPSGFREEDLGEPRFPLERMDPRVEIFLSPLTTHDRFYSDNILKETYNFKTA